MNTQRWIGLAAILVLLVGCGQKPAAVEPSATPVADETAAPSPSPVRTGVTILADGVLQAVQPPLPLAFEAGGKLLAVHVRAGDRVQAGDLVATLDDTQAQDHVAQARLSLQLAELALEDLTREADPAALAAAQASLASARASLAALTSPPGDQQLLAARQNLSAAKQALQNLLDLPDPDAVQIARTNLTAAEMQVQAAQAAYDQVAHLEYVAMTPQAMDLWLATTNYEQARAEYNEALEGASADQIATARAQVALAQADLDALQEDPDPDQVAAAGAQVEQAQAALDALLAGASAGDLTAAEINVAQARLALENAQRGLENVQLVAPAAATVIAVEAAPGALVGGGVPIVILHDTTQLEFHTTNLSERDLAQIFRGQAAVVTLKAYPDDPIETTVLRIGPQAGAPVGDAATFPVILGVSETGLDLRPGMTGRAEIRSKE
jgi:HlyD family secretion protein